MFTLRSKSRRRSSNCHTTICTLPAVHAVTRSTPATSTPRATSHTQRKPLLTTARTEKNATVPAMAYTRTALHVDHEEDRKQVPLGQEGTARVENVLVDGLRAEKNCDIDAVVRGVCETNRPQQREQRQVVSEQPWFGWILGLDQLCALRFPVSAPAQTPAPSLTLLVPITQRPTSAVKHEFHLNNTITASSFSTSSACKKCLSMVFCSALAPRWWLSLMYKGPYSHNELSTKLWLSRTFFFPACRERESHTGRPSIQENSRQRQRAYLAETLQEPEVGIISARLSSGARVRM